jgi:hypothetical protein
MNNQQNKTEKAQAKESKYGFKWKYVVGELKLIFKALPYNSVIDEFVEQYANDQKDDEAKSQKNISYTKQADIKFHEKIDDYAKEIRLPTYHLYHMKKSEERVGLLVRDIREHSSIRFSHFITMIAIVIAMLSLIIAIVSIAS